jgi:DNA-binding Lrp family transcriptional regulator
MDDIDGKILAALSGGIGFETNPFRGIAGSLGLHEDEVVDRIRSLVRDGVIRRISARINHRNLGIVYNAMVVWNVPERLVVKTGALMAGYPEVTHCYERECVPGRWDYNLYTVLHGYSEEEVDWHIRQLSELTGIDTYEVLYSLKELKRVPPGGMSAGGTKP